MNDFLTRLSRHLAIGTLCGFGAGGIAGGLGSRLAMRISALMTDARLQGRLTEAQARVGEITLGGSFFLIFFAAFIGIYAGLLYRFISTGISAKTWQKGLGFGLFLLLLHGTTLIEGDNFDFDRFGNIYVNLAMFILIPIAFGFIAAYLEFWLERCYPPFAVRPKPLLLYIPALVGIIVIVMLIVSQSASLQNRGATGIGGVEQVWISLVTLALMVVFALLEQGLKRSRYSLHLRLIAFALPALFGGFLLLQAILEILT
jgi:hypothetical protein